MNLRLIVLPTGAALLAAVAMYYGELGLFGGFHSGWYLSYSYLLVIPILAGVVLLTIATEDNLKALILAGVPINMAAAFSYGHASFSGIWPQIEFTLYHVPIAWFSAIAFCWMRQYLTRRPISTH
jgi:hypothetical protein